MKTHYQTGKYIHRGICGANTAKGLYGTHTMRDVTCKRCLQIELYDVKNQASKKLSDYERLIVQRDSLIQRMGAE